MEKFYKIFSKPLPTIKQIDDINYSEYKIHSSIKSEKSYYQQNNEWVKGNINKAKMRY